jgi:hypothetical protein
MECSEPAEDGGDVGQKGVGQRGIQRSAAMFTKYATLQDAGALDS